MTPSPPRRPSRLTWPVLARLLGRSLAGLALVWMVALVAWPENHRSVGLARASLLSLPRGWSAHRKMLRFDILERPWYAPNEVEPPWEDWVEVLERDSSLSALLGR